MNIVVCQTGHDKEIFEYIKQKRPNYQTANFRNIYVVADDRTGVVEVMDNRVGECKYHKFTFDQYLQYHETLVMEAAKALFPEGETK